MITVDKKYLVRPITKEMALSNFALGEKVLAVVGDPIYAVQIFFPQHHLVSDLQNPEWDFAKWYADWS